MQFVALHFKPAITHAMLLRDAEEQRWGEQLGKGTALHFVQR